MGQSTEDTTLAASGVWQQGQLLEVTIVDLNHNGEGVGRWQGRVVFVPDTVPGERALVRLVRVKLHYAQGKLHQLLESSPHRVRPSCIVADKCGGCQWQHLEYGQQLAAKRNLVVQDLERIGGFRQPVVDPVLAAAEPFGYRNKATYPVKATRPIKAARPEPNKVATSLQSGKQRPCSIQKTQLSQSSSTIQVQVQAGYYQKGSHQLINLNQCPIQDSRLNPFLAQIKQDIQQQGWSIYDETTHQGEVRHLGLRIGRHTGEVLLTLVVHSGNLPGVEQQTQTWMQRYPELVGVCLNINPHRTNTIFGSETRCLAGRPYLRELFAGLEFQIQPTTFFQVNTEQAEALVEVIQSRLELTGNETLVDAYCGIGTMTLPLAKRIRQAIGIEMQPEAIKQANRNAEVNQISNARFYVGKTEIMLPELTNPATGVLPDIILLDPPRKGCEPTVLETLLHLCPKQIVYISCNPSTLARDLKHLSQAYQLTRTQPVDFFPQTAHVECAAFLALQE